MNDSAEDCLAEQRTIFSHTWATNDDDDDDDVCLLAPLPPLLLPLLAATASVSALEGSNKMNWRRRRLRAQTGS